MERNLFKDYIIYDDSRIFSKLTNKFLKPGFNEYSQRYKVALSVYGKKRSYWLHNLMARAFINEYDQQNDLVKFKDNNPRNCSLYNLIIMKDARITETPDDELNKYFESEKPYMIVWGYIRKHFIDHNSYFLSSSFTLDDLAQYLVTLLHKRTLYYLKKQKQRFNYVNYAFNLFDRQFHSGDIYKMLQTYRSTFDIDNTFDYEVDPAFHFVSSHEYLKESYGRNKGESPHILNKL